MSEETQIDQVLSTATKMLADISESPRLDAELLLGLALDVPRSYLFAHPEDTLDALSEERYFRLIERRADGEPYAYIVGRKEFWSLELMVSPATLVPRPETETLLQHALKLIPRDASRRILDLGTGSGAIALAIAKARQACDVIATDASTDALAVARENARQLDISNVTFLQGDWTEPVRGETFDLVVSNPPYVESGDAALTNLKYEPISALVAGGDGLDAIRILARDCPHILATSGSLVLEHGAAQERQVQDILAKHGWTDIRCWKDLAGLPRVSIALRVPAVDDAGKPGP